jgi:predicted amidohydrolase
MTLIIAAAQSGSVPGDIPGNVAVHLRFGTAAAKCGVHLLVFPELSLTGYEPALAGSCAVGLDDPRLDSLRQLSEDANMTVVAGAPVRNSENQLHITALVFRPDGSGLVYTKEYLHSGEEEVFRARDGGRCASRRGYQYWLGHLRGYESPAASRRRRGSRGERLRRRRFATGEGLRRGRCAFKQLCFGAQDGRLMSNHSGPSGGWVSAGKSAIWSEDGGLVAASAGTDEGLIVGGKEHGVWKGRVLPLPS